MGVLLSWDSFEGTILMPTYFDRESNRGVKKAVAGLPRVKR